MECVGTWETRQASSKGGYRRTIGEKGVEKACRESDQFIVEE
jgi:hypothetical protein